MYPPQTAHRVAATKVLGDVVRAVAESNEAYEALGYFADDFMTGGCWVFAEALRRNLPGATLKALLNPKGQPEHVVVAYMGKLYDAYGAWTPTNMVQAFSEEFHRQVAVGPFDPATAGEVECPAPIAEKLTRLFTAALTNAGYLVPQAAVTAGLYSQTAWVEPSGVLRAFDEPDTHKRWAVEHVADLPPGEDPQDVLLQRGWVRLGAISPHAPYMHALGMPRRAAFESAQAWVAGKASPRATVTVSAAGRRYDVPVGAFLALPSSSGLMAYRMAKTARTLYHGTSVERARKIEQEGLEPQVGDLTSTAYEEDAESVGETLEPLVFAGDKEALQRGVYSAMMHAIQAEGHDITNAEQAIRNWGALVLLKDGDEVMDHRPETEDPYGYTDHPLQVETGDYYSREGLVPDHILTGPTLVRYLKHQGVDLERWSGKPSQAERNRLIGMARVVHPEIPAEKVVERVNGLDRDQFRKSMAFYTKATQGRTASKWDKPRPDGSFYPSMDGSGDFPAVNAEGDPLVYWNSGAPGGTFCGPCASRIQAEEEPGYIDSAKAIREDQGALPAPPPKCWECGKTIGAQPLITGSKLAKLFTRFASRRIATVEPLGDGSYSFTRPGGALSLMLDEERHQAYVLGLAVDEGLRGQGIATQLYVEANNWLKAKGFQHLHGQLENEEGVPLKIRQKLPGDTTVWVNPRAFSEAMDELGYDGDDVDYDPAPEQVPGGVDPSWFQVWGLPKDLMALLARRGVHDAEAYIQMTTKVAKQAAFFTKDEIKARAREIEERTGKSSRQLREETYRAQDGHHFPGFTRKAALFVRGATVRRIRTLTTDEGTFSIWDIDADHRRPDMFTVWEHPDGWIVRNVLIPEELQRQGIASRTYAMLNRLSLKATRHPLRSTQARALLDGQDVLELSESGRALWDSFVTKGQAEATGDTYRFKRRAALFTRFASLQQDQALTFIQHLRSHGLRFRANEAGTRTVYVEVTTPGGPLKVRFSDHGVPPYKDPRLEVARRNDISIDPTTGKTLEDALELVLRR